MENSDILKNRLIHLNQLLANNLQQGNIEEINRLETEIKQTQEELASLEI